MFLRLPQSFIGRSGTVFKPNGRWSDAMGAAFGELHGFNRCCGTGWLKFLQQLLWFVAQNPQKTWSFGFQQMFSELVSVPIYGLQPCPRGSWISQDSSHFWRLTKKEGPDFYQLVLSHTHYHPQICKLQACMMKIMLFSRVLHFKINLQLGITRILGQKFGAICQHTEAWLQALWGGARNVDIFS